MDYTGNKESVGCGGSRKEGSSCGSIDNGGGLIREVYYGRDFMIRLDFMSRGGEPREMPPYDFEIELRTRLRGRCYKAWQRGKHLNNIVTDDTGRAWIVVSGHQLETGELWLKLKSHVRDSRFPSGYREEESETDTQIYLTDGPARDVELSVTLTLPCAFDGGGWNIGTPGTPGDKPSETPGDKPSGTPGDKPSDTPGNPDTPPSGGGGYEPATDEEVEEILKDLLQ